MISLTKSTAVTSIHDPHDNDHDDHRVRWHYPNQDDCHDRRHDRTDGFHFSFATKMKNRLHDDDDLVVVIQTTIASADDDNNSAAISMMPEATTAAVTAGTHVRTMLYLAIHVARQRRRFVPGR